MKRETKRGAWKGESREIYYCQMPHHPRIVWLVFKKLNTAIHNSTEQQKQDLLKTILPAANGVYSSKWRPAARAKGGGHSQTRGRAGVPEISESTVFFDWPILHEILFHTNKTVQVFFFLLLLSSSVHFNYTLYLWLLFFNYLLTFKKKMCKWEIKSVGIRKKLCRQHMNAESSSCPTIISSLSIAKSVPMIPRYGHQMCSVLLVGDVAWKTGRNHALRVIFLPSSAWHVDHRLSIQIESWVRASFLYMHREPPKLFFVLFCQPFYISRVSLFFFFFSSVVALHAQTLKNVGPLDCKFRLLRRRSLLSVGGKISVAEVMHLLTLNVFAANFRVVLVVVTFFSFFFSVVNLNTSFLSRNSLGVHVDWDVICSTTTRRVDVVVAFKSSGHCAGELDFSVPTVFKPFEDGVDRAKACLVPLKKKTWAWGMSPNLKFHTVPTRTLAQSKAWIKRKVSWWTLMATATAFEVPTFCHCHS